MRPQLDTLELALVVNRYQRQHRQHNAIKSLLCTRVEAEKFSLDSEDATWIFLEETGTLRGRRRWLGVPPVVELDIDCLLPALDTAHSRLGCSARVSSGAMPAFGLGTMPVFGWTWLATHSFVQQPGC